MRSLFRRACRHSYASSTTQIIMKQRESSAFVQFAKRAMSATNHFQTLGIDVSDNSRCLSISLHCSFHDSSDNIHVSIPMPDAKQQSFTISPADLKTKYKSLMMELHPDRHVDNTEKEAKSAEATHVTRAYDVLNNPLSRALHLLELSGSGIEEGDAVSFIMFGPNG